MYEWNGGLSKQQLAWVKTELESATESQEKVGFYCHFPVYGEEDQHRLWNFEEFLELVEPYECVKFYFNGHNHNGDYMSKSGIHFVTFKGMVDEENANAYAKLRFVNDSILIRGYGREPSRALQIR